MKDFTPGKDSTKNWIFTEEYYRETLPSAAVFYQPILFPACIWVNSVVHCLVSEYYLGPRFTN
jgi:hypothetical protein